MLTLADQRRHQASALIRIDGMPGSDDVPLSPAASKWKTNRLDTTRATQSDGSSSSSDEDLDQAHEWPRGLEQWAVAGDADLDLDEVEIEPQVSSAFGNAFTAALIEQKAQADAAAAKSQQQMNDDVRADSADHRPASAAAESHAVSSALAMIANVSFLPEEKKKRVRSAATSRPQSAAAAFSGGAHYSSSQRGANSRSAPPRSQRPSRFATGGAAEWNDDVLLPGRRARSAGQAPGAHQLSRRRS